MSKRKPARTIKARSTSKIRSKAAGSGQPKGRANSKQARVLALLCGPSRAMKAGRPARFDYEYERNGTANLFMLFAPLEGWRHVQVTDRHTAVDYARVLKDLA